MFSLIVRVGMMVLVAGGPCVGPWAESAQAQMTGNEAEMERLQRVAEEAIANGDADGASLASGKAALMAGQLALSLTDRALVAWYRGAESLFRGQEHAYRALALFQRAGGQPPASSGVCGSLALAEQAVERSRKTLADVEVDAMDSTRRERHRRWREMTQEWGKTIVDMAGDFQCR